MNRVPNPILGPNKFKFGLFNANCDGGFAISKAPERWRCEWDGVVKACVMADEAGIDFILPVAKWRGLSGEADNLGRSFETLTHGAAIGALTKRIGLFATVHCRWRRRPLSPRRSRRSITSRTAVSASTSCVDGIRTNLACTG